VRLGGFSLYVTDVLPTSLTVRAFNRILNHGASLADVWVELLSISVLTALYFAVGTWLFTRRHYRVWSGRSITAGYGCRSLDSSYTDG